MAEEALRCPVTSLRIDPVHGITVGNRLELGQRRADGDWKVVAATGRDAHILAEDGRPFGRLYNREVDTAPTSLTKDRIATSGFNVLYPIRSCAEHRDQIASAFDRGDDNSCDAPLTGCSTADFQDPSS